MIDRSDSLSVGTQAKLLGMSRAAVYYMPRPASAIDLTLMRATEELHVEFPFMGSRQVCRQLLKLGHKAAQLHVHTLMKKMGIAALAPELGTSQRNPLQKVYPHLLRKLTIVRSNQVWALDCTYIPMERGFVHLTAVVDGYSRRVQARRVAISREAVLAQEVVQEALNRYGTPGIVNTDQGNQFTAREIVDAVLDSGAKLSKTDAETGVTTSLSSAFGARSSTSACTSRPMNRSARHALTSPATSTGTTANVGIRAMMAEPPSRIGWRPWLHLSRRQKMKHVSTRRVTRHVVRSSQATPGAVDNSAPLQPRLSIGVKLFRSIEPLLCVFGGS